MKTHSKHTHTHTHHKHFKYTGIHIKQTHTRHTQTHMQYAPTCMYLLDSTKKLFCGKLKHFFKLLSSIDDQTN